MESSIARFGELSRSVGLVPLEDFDDSLESFSESLAEDASDTLDFNPLEGIEPENAMEDEHKEFCEGEDIESHMEKIVVLDDAESCSVCLQDMDSGADDAVVLKCSHTFHKKCMLEWSRRKPNCPLCRHDMRKDRPQTLKRKRLTHDGEELERRNKH
ncbi:hypothetical protein MKW94_029875 [Papaver nudicaule]|uniref:RING-type domain-containing protein n=1 Tax=Papaver nudicaule TaxID=74823 RepID=A0AA41V0S9_PAPNU|nr:hypothetical protein [Papaver nudicaule]